MIAAAPLLLPFEAAQDAVIAACGPLASETVALADAAGRVAAETLVAREDLVPFARSAMDGFAVASADLAAAPIVLPLAAGVFAAPGAPAPLQRGSAVPIATGAPLPPGADAVVPIEATQARDGAVAIDAAVAPGDHVFPPGEDARSGDVLVARGTVLDAAVLGILAAAGEICVRVTRRPRIVLICGGDELVEPHETPGAGQIRNSNAVVLTAALRAFGADIVRVQRVPDRRAAVHDALTEALDEADLVVTTGGASVGERDYVKRVCDGLGVTFAFRSVALRPAKPTAFGRRGDAAIAVLPGNPAAAYVALHELVRPALYALAGRTDTRPPALTVALDGTIRAKAARSFAAFAALEASPAGLRARPLANQCSSLTRTVAEAAGVIVVPPGEATYGAGDAVRFDVFAWHRLTVTAQHA